MEPLTQQFLDSCRRDGGRILRGESMTRIETFVDAAFAFSFTMMVISIDQIPRSPAELLELSRDIPAFILSTIIIGSIWLAHSDWSRTFGLQDRATINLSLALVVLVLIFVYPIKLMSQSTVIYLSTQVFNVSFLDTGLFANEGWNTSETADLFIYFGLGLMVLSMLIIALYQNTLRHQQALVLNQVELDYCQVTSLIWLVVGLTALLSCVMALYVGDNRVAWPGFVYFSLFISLQLTRVMYFRFREASLPPPPK